MVPTSTSASETTPINNTTLSATFQYTVSLYDWWLIKSEKDFNGRRLAVGGLTSRRTSAARIFSSAPIVNRYDMLNLETSDGVTILIKGYINKTRTLESGISSAVCNRFLIGFPYNWEDFCYHFGEESFSLNIFGQSNDCSNSKEEGNFSKENSDDADISNENKVGAEVVSNMSKTNHSEYEMSVNVALRDHLLLNVSDIKNSVTPSKADMSNSKEKPYLGLSRSEKVKYLSNRIKTICSAERKSSNLCDSVHQENVNVMVTPVGMKSCSAKRSNLSNVDHLEIAEKNSVTSPNDACKVLTNNLNSNEETTQNDASKGCLIESGSDNNGVCISAVDIVSSMGTDNNVNRMSMKDTVETADNEHLTRRNPSNGMSPSSKRNSDNEPTGLNEVRRRSRGLKNEKEPAHGQETIQGSKTILVSTGSDLLSTAEEKNCDLGAKNVQGSSSLGHNENMCKSPLQLTSEHADHIVIADSSNQKEACKKSANANHRSKRSQDKEPAPYQTRSKRSRECVS